MSSLFKRIHTVTVPPEFLAEGASATQLRFSQLNPKKMAKASLNDTLSAIDRQNEIMAKLSDEQRQASLDRQRTQDAESIKRAQERAEAPDAFGDFDQHTLVALAHVEHQVGTKWVELTSDEIDELLCLDWLAGEIYDVSKPKSAKVREKNLVGLAAHLSHGAPLPFETWIASLCRAYHQLPSDVLRELQGDTADLFLDMLSSDHFMEGWEARREALRAVDAKSKERILDDHRQAIALVERVMAQLHDQSE